jgi:hypothetical protein
MRKPGILEFFYITFLVWLQNEKKKIKQKSVPAWKFKKMSFAGLLLYKRARNIQENRKQI